MSSYDKVVKLACKPKAAPPKAKYLDPIIAATWSEDGAVHDVCRALVPRFREPNAIIVFKALIVLHTMIRNGATDNVLSHLSSSEVLRLHNVSSGTWEGYNAPQNLQLYAMYLDSRIRAYRELQHDAIRVQAESNRDIRLQNSLDEEAASSRSRNVPKSKGSTVPQRSKTIMGRKLRVMTVEKGLLRETRVVQKMIDAVVECRFYLDDLEDELTITALRMLVKDLLILFQAGNEGVINVLEHYFEMSHVDAEQALAIYRHFCKQTERVVEYLGVAKKLQNLLNVPIPNLKHAPVSLAGALEEYLNDPNFEQNRIEYKTNKAAADKNGKAPVKKDSSSAPADSRETSKVATVSAPPPTNTPSSMFSSPLAGASTSKADSNQAIVDFFSAIEEQPTIFNPQTGSPTMNHFQQQAAHNPFVQRQFTGAPGTQPFSLQNQTHPQTMGFAAMQQPFQNQPDTFGFQGPQQSQHRPFSSFLQQQSTGLPPVQPPTFLQPQATGANPFRQSIMLPQATGLPPFNLANTPSLPNAFQSQPFAQTQSVQMGSSPSQFFNSAQSQSSTQQPFSQTPATFSIPSSNIPFAQPNPIQTSSDLPARPASTPLRSFASSSPPPVQPVKTHQTGSRNPFGIPVTPAPPVPKPPTLMELAMGIGGNGVNAGTSVPQSQPQQPQQTGTFAGFDNGSTGAAQSKISNVASSFTLGNKPSVSSSAAPFAASGFGSSPLNAQTTSTTTTSSTFSDSLFSSSLSTQPTGATVTSSAPSISAATSTTLKPQITGFGGLKPFKPSSSFGASLLESLPPIPQSGSTTPAVTGSNPSSSATGAPAGTAFGSNFSSLQQQSTTVGTLNAQATGAGQSTFPGLNAGSSIGAGLRPQATGASGPVNPFRASMFPASTGGFGSPSFPPSTSMPQFGPFGGSANGMIGNTMSGTGLVSGDFPSNFGSGGQEASKQYQQRGATSLI